VSITLTLQKTGDERRPASAPLASESAVGGATSRSRRRVGGENVGFAV
jgi:hypothetical protein